MQKIMTIMLGALLLAGCSPEPQVTAQPQVAPPPHPEQQLIEDLVLASRVLVSEGVDVLDTGGHVSVRSRISPDRYYISRYVAPGVVTVSDIIENDLNNKPVNGPRDDEYEEVYIHGEIYKARPDVMAVVHGHPAELVAFSVSSVPLHHESEVVPVWDARAHNNGKFSIINTPALAASMAQTLGSGNAVLLHGHGVVVAGNSVRTMVREAYRLRNAARLEQMMISMGGSWDPAPRRFTPLGDEPSLDEPVVVNVAANQRMIGRDWEYWKQGILEQTGGAVPPGPLSQPPRPADKLAAVKEDLALASRIMASRSVDVLDAYGHVSVRSPDDPNRYFLPRFVAAGSVTANDILEYTLDSKPVAGASDDQFQEVYLHGEIYKARPDVMAIVHSHTPELIAFSQSSVKLRPVINQGRFIGDGLPIFDIRKFDPRARIVNTSRLGQALAQTLGDKPAVLLSGHGVALTDSSLAGLVGRAYGIRKNAQVQQQAIALKGKISYLEGPQAAESKSRAPIELTGDGGGPGTGRMWEYYRQVLAH